MLHSTYPPLSVTNECQELPGANYRGNESVTKSNKTCQNWSTNSPHVPHAPHITSTKGMSDTLISFI